MKAGNYYGGKDFRVEAVPDPIVGVGEVLVRVMTTGICGSDLHEYRGEFPSVPLESGRILGHELVGVIADLGKDAGGTGLNIGTRVGINPLVGCGRCDRCRAGMSYLCFVGQTLGIHRPGGFAEYTSVPCENCYPLPDSVSNDAGALLDVYACALHGLTRVPVNPGDYVAVIGSGAMAIAFAETSLLAGASSVAIIGRHKSTVTIVASLVNATAVCSADQEVVQAIKDWSNGRGADVIYECAGGTNQTLGLALEMARQGGKIGVEGVHTCLQTIDSTYALLHELTVTWFYSHGRRGEPTEYEIALDLMAKKRIKPEMLITHHFLLDDISDAFAVADNHAISSSIKVLIHPN